MQFDKTFTAELNKCECCFNCIKIHSDEGCQQCLALLEKFFPANPKLKISKSVASELKSALVELFKEMKLSCIKVEGQLELNCSNFIDDMTKMLDEIRDPDDIIKFWHVERDLARNVYLVLQDVIFGDYAECFSSSDESEDSSADDEDLSGSEENISSDEDVD